jgi:hypothetical protein
MPGWLNRTEIALFISHRRLAKYRTLPKANGPWALDSGGFTELSMHGGWQTPASQYVDAVRRYQEIGYLQWAAPQDWMCEPWIVAKTGLSVVEHQKRTVYNYLELREHLNDAVIPVMQGWQLDDYHRIAEMYADAGVDLAAQKIVGLGSVCRRQGTQEISDLITVLVQTYGVRLHGFGVKTEGIRSYGWQLASADSMAWTIQGRYEWPCPKFGHKSCANCWHFAMEWRERVLNATPKPTQLPLF